MTDTQDAAQGVPGEQACQHDWLSEDGMASRMLLTNYFRSRTGMKWCQRCGSLTWYDRIVVSADHNAVRELREALDGLLTKYEEVVEMYVRPNMDCRAKDSSGDVEYTAARDALAHSQGADAEESQGV